MLGASSLLLIAIYPFMKRVTWWPQAWLGLTFNWGALVGYSARTGHLGLSAFALYAGCFFWTLGYDTIYAHQDREDDALIGVKSTARLLGSSSRVWIAIFYGLTLVLLTVAAWPPETGFAVLLLTVAAHFAWQVRRLDIDDPGQCLRIFRANRDAGALIAASFLVTAWLTPLV
jgi:4-hydroxybenzoate polyprenyltransferase